MQARLVSDNRNLAMRIWDTIVDFLRRIKAAIRGGTYDGEARRYLEKLQTELSGKADEWSAALKATNKAAESGTKKAAKRGDVQFTIKYDKENTPFVIVDTDVLSGVPKKEWIKTVKDNLRQRYPSGIEIGNNVINIDGTSRREMTFSRYSQFLIEHYPDIFSDKLRVLNNADEIVRASRNYVNEALNHPRHDNIQEFARGDVFFRIGENEYTAEVVVGKRSNEKLLLYDILNMQQTSIQEKSQTQKSVNSRNRETGRSSASNNNSISKSEEKSNTDFPQNKASLKNADLEAESSV